jgi:hypothetical protein
MSTIGRRDFIAASVARIEENVRACARSRNPGHPLSQQRLPGSRATLAEAGLILRERAAPVLRQQPVTNVVVKRGIRPVAQAGNHAMLYGVERHVIDMSLEIQIVTDRMLPESTLPQRNLSIPATGNLRSRPDDRVRKSAFDEAQSDRIVGIPFRQGHDNVNVVRQDHDRIDHERMRCASLLDGRAERLDVVDQRRRGSIRERDGEEERAARNEITTVPFNLTRVSWNHSPDCGAVFPDFVQATRKRVASSQSGLRSYDPAP